MKKILTILFSFILAVIVALPMQDFMEESKEEPKQEQVKQEEQVQLNEVPQKGQGTVEIGFIATDEQEGKTLMESIKSIAEVEEKDGFINGIEDMVANPDEKEFIAIYVNNEMAMVGANDLVLKSGDKVEFKLESFK